MIIKRRNEIEKKTLQNQAFGRKKKKKRDAQFKFHRRLFYDLKGNKGGTVG